MLTCYNTYIKSNSTRKFMTPLLSIAFILAPQSAYACGGIFDVVCNLQHGGLSPGNIIDQTKIAGQDVANALNELQASTLTGPALEQAIISSHNTAINGSNPIPIQMRQQLAGYASEDSMNRVRYKIGDNGFANLAHLIEQGGGAAAVTLIDVIVFNGPSEANDPALWAHELTHVDQYQAWGVHSFAVSYTRNWQSVENSAYDKGNGYWNWRNNRSNSYTQQPNYPQQQFAVGSRCYTPYGVFGPYPQAAQVGSPCFVNLPQGTVYGQVGQ